MKDILKILIVLYGNPQKKNLIGKFISQIIFAFALIALVAAKPQRGLPLGPPPPGSEAAAEIVSQDFNIEPDGSYQSS